MGSVVLDTGTNIATLKAIDELCGKTATQYRVLGVGLETAAKKRRTLNTHSWRQRYMNALSQPLITKKLA
jgi:hypothetical protein